MTDIAPDMIMQRLKGFIEDRLLNQHNIAPDDDLLMTGLIDSLAVMSLIAFIEETFSFKIPFEDVVYENFMSLDTITQYIHNALSQNA